MFNSILGFTTILIGLLLAFTAIKMQDIDYEIRASIITPEGRAILLVIASIITIAGTVLLSK